MLHYGPLETLPIVCQSCALHLLDATKSRRHVCAQSCCDNGGLALVVCWSWLCVGFCCCVAWFGVFGTWSLCSSHKGLAHTAPKAQYHNYVKCRGDVCTTTVRMGQITSHGRSRSTMLQLAYGFPDALKTGLEKAIHSSSSGKQGRLVSQRPSSEKKKNTSGLNESWRAIFKEWPKEQQVTIEDDCRDPHGGINTFIKPWSERYPRALGHGTFCRTQGAKTHVASFLHV